MKDLASASALCRRAVGTDTIFCPCNHHTGPRFAPGQAMIIAYFPTVVCLIGLIIYLAVKNNGEVKEVGKIMFWTGLLVTLAVSAGWRLQI